MSDPVYVLTYESGEYSSWNLQVSGVYTSKDDADADCAALNAAREGYEVTEFALCTTRNLLTCPWCGTAFVNGTEVVKYNRGTPGWDFFSPCCGGQLAVSTENRGESIRKPLARAATPGAQP